MQACKLPIFFLLTITWKKSFDLHRKWMKRKRSIAETNTLLNHAELLWHTSVILIHLCWLVAKENLVKVVGFFFLCVQASCPIFNRSTSKSLLYNICSLEHTTKYFYPKLIYKYIIWIFFFIFHRLTALKIFWAEYCYSWFCQNLLFQVVHRFAAVLLFCCKYPVLLNSPKSPKGSRLHLSRYIFNLAWICFLVLRKKILPVI